MAVVDKNQFKPEHKKKSIRSYVVRSGRMTEGQLKALENHWQQYRLSLFDGAPGSWAEVFQREAPLVLEIGFGMGDSLLEMAINEPDKDFIGIEVYPPGAGRLVSNAVEKGISNLKVYLADAVDVLDDCISEQSLSRVQIYFPDPWHKKKHNKRRLVQMALVEKIRDKLMVGGVFHLATDWQPSAEQMLEVTDKVAGFENTAQQGGYSVRPEYRPKTKFERRGLKLGHGVRDLVYQRTS
jgi:tRNA (guanine-N7-)-methyltransferase